MSHPMPEPNALSEVERIKLESRRLRGTIAEGLRDPATGGICERDNILLKFHGSYQQDDRDVRLQRQEQKLEPAYQFMIRARLPGGVCTPAQWLALDALATTHADGTLRLTSRQTFQLHGVLKHMLKQTIAGINQALLTTFATCGDVNRNVMCNPDPEHSQIHREVYALSARLSEHLLPRTRAYHEIWLDERRVAATPAIEAEPLYSDRYLPRKFKIAMAVPPSNDVDVFANDLGFIAIVQDQRLVGFNVTVGGGMGMTHGDTSTFPRVADVLGFCTPEQVVAVAEAVIGLQRDAGNRSERRHARFKYTVEWLGLESVRDELGQRLGWTLGEPHPFRFTHTGDRLGWHQDRNGDYSFTVHIPSGRVCDRAEQPLMSGLRALAQAHEGDFRLTPSQNLMICGITPQRREVIAQILGRFRLDDPTSQSGLRLNAMACVSFPTCGLAMAESERFMPGLLDEFDTVLARLGLQDQSINLRMTGCPNGCVRPFLGEIGIVGKGPGLYNVYLGGAANGSRPNRLYREAVRNHELVGVLEPLLQHYGAERAPDEAFGDFVIRAGYVEPPGSGPAFHSRGEHSAG